MLRIPLPDAEGQHVGQVCRTTPAATLRQRGHIVLLATRTADLAPVLRQGGSAGPAAWGCERAPWPAGAPVAHALAAQPHVEW